MFDEIKNIASGKKELRDFGFVVGGVLVAVSMVFWWLERESHRVWGSVGIVLAGAGLFAPFILKPLQKVWMAFAVVMGWVMTRFILGALYYGVFTVVHGIGWIVGKEFLDMRYKDGSSTYWVKRASRDVPVSEYERQF